MRARRTPIASLSPILVLTRSRLCRSSAAPTASRSARRPRPLRASFVCSFPDGPASSIVSVQVKDSDNAYSNTDTQTVTVSNVAPTVTLSASNDLSVDEGSQHTYSFTVTDPGVDTLQRCVSQLRRLTAVQVGTTTRRPRVAVSSARSRMVRRRAPCRCRSRIPTTTPSNTATQTVTINNVKPSIELTGSATANEGDTNTYSYTVTDPGQDTHTIATACGLNGAKVIGSDTYNAGTGVGSFQCFFADGPAIDQRDRRRSPIPTVLLTPTTRSWS